MDSEDAHSNTEDGVKGVEASESSFKFDPFVPEPSELSQLQPGCKERASLPFGKDGTIVHANIFGAILQISAYNSQKSELIAAELADDQSGHYYPGRRRDALFNDANVTNHGLGLYLDSFGLEKLQIQWVFHRWPRVSYELNEEFHVIVQLFVTQGVVVQQYQIKNLTDSSKSIDFYFNLNFAIRPHCEAYNKYDSHDEAPVEAQGSTVLRNSSESTDLRVSLFHNRHVLPLTPFREGDSGASSLAGGHFGWARVRLGKRWLQPRRHWKQAHQSLTVLAGHVDELVALYRLEELQKPSLDPPSSPPKYVRAYKDLSSYVDLREPMLAERSRRRDEEQKQEQQENQEGEHNEEQRTELNEEHDQLQDTRDNAVTFLLQRHLEHLLSVCAIPIPERGKAIAFVDASITFSSVSSQIGFFTFRYLLMMFKYLERKQSTIHHSEKRYYQERIRRTCIMHLKWAFEVAEVDKNGSWFVTYSPSGKIRTAENKGSEPSFAAGSLYHLMLCEFLRVFPDEFIMVLEFMGKRTKKWLESLGKARHKSMLWFDHTIKLDIQFHDLYYREGYTLEVPKYKLTGLATLWRTLAAIDGIVEILYGKLAHTDAATKRESEVQENLEVLDEVKKKVDELDHSKIRKLILEQFIIDPGIANGENTSSWRTFKTADATAGQSVVNPVEEGEERSEGLTGQRRKELHETSPAGLEKVGSQKANGGSAGPGSKPKRMLTFSRSAQHDVIRDLFYTNDTLLFEAADAGFFDDGTGREMDIWKETVVKQSQQHTRGSGWSETQRYSLALMIWKSVHVKSFSTTVHQQNECLSLLRSAVFDSGLVASAFDPESELPSKRSGKSIAPFQIPALLLWNKCPECSPMNIKLEKGKDPLAGPFTKTRPYGATLPRKKSQITYADIDKKNIVDGPNIHRGWLYRTPDFFHAEPIQPDVEDIMESLQASTVLEEGFKTWKESEAKSFSSAGQLITIVDVKDKKRGLSVERSIGTKLYDFLCASRTPSDAKKRFIYIPRCTSDTALISCITAPERERQHLANFFNRHALGSNFQQEWLHRLANIWESEFHLRFLQVTDSSGIEDDIATRRIMNINKEDFLDTNEGAKKFIIQAAVSYRFVGDLQDRYWTCHVSSHMVNTYESWITDDVDEYESWLEPKDKQDQRKVLEVYLFEKMTEVACKSGDQILIAVEDILREDGTFSIKPGTYTDTFETRYSRSRSLSRIAQFLRKFEENYKSMLEAITQWEKRREFRSVQPRWTLKDEQKCRVKLGYHYRRAQMFSDRLRAQQAKMGSLLTFATHQQDAILSDLQLAEARRSTRLSEDVRLFTYATIVFLPLSFSSSLFSMAGKPNGSTVAIMAQTTMVALAITFFVLANVKLIDRYYRWFFYRIYDYAREKMRESTIPRFADWRRIADELEKARLRNIQYDVEESQDEKSFWWLFWFWITWLLLLPADMVSHAIATVWDVQRTKRRQAEEEERRERWRRQLEGVEEEKHTKNKRGSVERLNGDSNGRLVSDENPTVGGVEGVEGDRTSDETRRLKENEDHLEDDRAAGEQSERLPPTGQIKRSKPLEEDDQPRNKVDQTSLALHIRRIALGVVFSPVFVIVFLFLLLLKMPLLLWEAWSSIANKKAGAEKLENSETGSVHTESEPETSEARSTHSEVAVPEESPASKYVKDQQMIFTTITDPVAALSLLNEMTTKGIVSMIKKEKKRREKEERKARNKASRKGESVIGGDLVSQVSGSVNNGNTQRKSMPQVDVESGERQEVGPVTRKPNSILGWISRTFQWYKRREPNKDSRENG